MIIIIDGYNFLKSVLGTKFVPDADMIDWMNQFNDYIHRRGNQIIVVFDAGPSFFTSKEFHKSVEIIYSGQHQTADDILKKWLEKNQAQDVLLVTSDREIRNFAQRLGVTSLAVMDFYTIFKDVMHQNIVQSSYDSDIVYKTKIDAKNNDEMLDALMQQASQAIHQYYDKDNDVDDDKSYRVNAHKDSKSDKHIMRKINKI